MSVVPGIGGRSRIRRHQHTQGGSLWLRLAFNDAAVVADDLSDQRQTEAGAVGLGCDERLEEMGNEFVGNAAEAVGGAADGEIVLTTAYKPGFRLSVPGNPSKVTLPLEFCVRDNGGGVPDELIPHLFEPFVTTKANGTGLGLALVAKIIRDHGGVIECESKPKRT